MKKEIVEQKINLLYFVEKIAWSVSTLQYFVQKAILAFNYSITSTFDDTSDRQTSPKGGNQWPGVLLAFPCNALKRGRATLTFRAGLSVRCVIECRFYLLIKGQMALYKNLDDNKHLVY